VSSFWRSVPPSSRQVACCEVERRDQLERRAALLLHRQDVLAEELVDLPIVHDGEAVDRLPAAALRLDRRE
jgi:hypothetical protein